MKLPKGKRRSLRKQLAESGVEKKSRRRAKRGVKAEVRQSDHAKPSISFNYDPGSLVRLPKELGGHTVMLIEEHQGGEHFRYLDPITGQIRWVKAAKLRPA